MQRVVSYLLKKFGLVTLAQMNAAIAALEERHTQEVHELHVQIALLKRPCSQRSVAVTMPVCESCPKHLALVERTEGAVTRMDEVVTKLETMLQETWPDDIMQEETDRRLVEAAAR